MPRCKVNDGFVYVTNYSYQFRGLIQSIAEKAEKVLPSKKLNSIGIFLFGSPSRQEMIDESDADIMIIRKEDNEDYNKFRRKFICLLEKENFPKIDVPDWGNYLDCEKYIRYSITEGNQIIESKFIYGDVKVREFIEGLRSKYCSIERFEKIFCFQKFYFDQYYTQRTQSNIKNVKYGHGGTRDFMFITWYVNLLDSLEGKKTNIEDNFPLVYRSLTSLYERKWIGLEDYNQYLESINVVLILRNEILIQNRLTSKKGLTYLDKKTVITLFRRKIFKDESISSDVQTFDKYLNLHIERVAELKQKIWNCFLDYLSETKGKIWKNTLDKSLTGNFSKDVIEKVNKDDELLQMAIIWNINRDKEPKLFEQVFKEYSKSKSWVVLSSLCCHEQCPSNVLDSIVKTGFNKGYEYILKIISRNKNVTKETLKKIIENPNLENRYKITAQIAYEKGVKKANELR